MELRQVRYFLSVAKHRSFTRAAAELFVVQPALSQQIKRLEHELGVELIDRRGGQVTLTLAGMTFLRRAEVILSDVNIALSEMRGFSEATTGRVALGAMFTLNNGAVDFPNLFSGFSENYPGVQLRFREGSTDELLGLLRNGELDLALVDLSVVADASDLATDLITDEELVVLVGPNHRLARAGSLSIDGSGGRAFHSPGQRPDPHAQGRSARGGRGIHAAVCISRGQRGHRAVARVQRPRYQRDTCLGWRRSGASSGESEAGGCAPSLSRGHGANERHVSLAIGLGVYRVRLGHAALSRVLDDLNTSLLRPTPCR